MTSRITFRTLLSASVLSLGILMSPAMANSPSPTSSSSGFSRPSTGPTTSTPAARAPEPSVPRYVAPTPPPFPSQAPAASNSGFSRPSAVLPPSPPAAGSSSLNLPAVAAPPPHLAQPSSAQPTVSTTSRPAITAPSGALAGAAAAGGAAAAYQSYQADRASVSAPLNSEHQRTPPAYTPSPTYAPPAYTAPRQETRTVVERETVYVPAPPQVVYVPTPPVYQPAPVAPAYMPRPVVQSAPMNTASGSSFAWLWWMLGLGVLTAGVYVLFTTLRNR